MDYMSEVTSNLPAAMVDVNKPPFTDAMKVNTTHIIAQIQPRLYATMPYLINIGIDGPF